LKINSFQALFVFFFFGSCFVSAQITEADLQRLGTNYLLPQNASQRDSLAGVFADSLWAFIQDGENYGNELKSVRNLSVQLPDDQSFALYTWAVPGPNGDFTFHGYLWNNHWKDKKRLVLADVGTEDAPYRYLKGEQWVGGICYQIITTKHKGEKSYTLLSFRPGRSYHTKFIDALELGSRSDRCQFGSRIFNIRSNGDERYQRRPYRIQFRYNSALTAAVRYDGEHRGIICDHLAPSQAELTERWFAYGPDFSYDRIYWTQGKWEIQETYPLVRNLEVAPTNNRIPTGLDPNR
jgi:hypothetical protein